MSNLLRAEAISVLDHRQAGHGVSLPRVVATRVLRGEHVGLQRPLHLAVPITPALRHADQPHLEDAPASQVSVADLSEIQEAARVQGYNVGYERGYAEGLAAAEEAIGRSVRRLAAMVENVHEAHATFFRGAERQVVDLALQIAQKVIEREVENIPDLAVNVIRAALEEMDARTAVRVRVSPDDEELLRRRWPQVVPPGNGADRIELQSDERVQPGGAIIETTHGQVDAQLETKLAQLGNALWTFVMDASSSREAQDETDA
jgi:flagellar biosynthesis/type III secretory pathway protein FliH